MVLNEARESLCRKLNIKWSDITANTQELFNWDDIDDFIKQGCLEAWDFAPWIFKEKAYTTTTVASTEYYDYPDDFVSDSIYLLRITDSNAKLKTYRKIRYADYMKYREGNEDGQEKLWSDHHRFYFANPKAFDDAASRTIEIWGLLRFSDFTASTSVLPFSPSSDNEENSGNHAVIRLAYAYALESDKLNNPNKAVIERNIAYQTLKMLSDREASAQPDYEVMGTPFFRYRNLFPGGGGRGKKVFEDGTDSWNY